MDFVYNVSPKPEMGSGLGSQRPFKMVKYFFSFLQIFCILNLFKNRNVFLSWKSTEQSCKGKTLRSFWLQVHNPQMECIGTNNVIQYRTRLICPTIII